jgi:murein DD-endopeptidase MepM/ murein hydrolase activator NlpD
MCNKKVRDIRAVGVIRLYNSSVKSPSYRAILWPLLLVFAIAALTIFVVRFPENYPEKTLVIERNVQTLITQFTLPIKLARLAAQEPDKQILMPVHGTTVGRVSDTWSAPRGTDRQHEGQDIFAPRGTPIFSGTYGFVRRIDNTTLGGNVVFVTGAGGRRYYYAHLDHIADGLSVGQEVTTDTVLGFVGNTGNAIATPPHLHFGVYVNREAINPLPLLADRQ